MGQACTQKRHPTKWHDAQAAILFPPRSGRAFATDGRTILARRLEFLCFNDRYVRITSYKFGDSGIYDAQTDAKVREEQYDTVARELRSGRGGCNGYYTGLLGAVFLLDGQKFPFLPPCEWRNLNNPALKNRAWFDRPCDDRSGREEMRAPTVAGDTAVQSDLGP
ncbi:hypothetical protein [Paracoccus aminovorans]|uniref:hypothetical protein n=1 Tax=Paracoccus aminovorans TaxID=34004 RepID=UPI000AB4A1DD|nr:hypothetical protein [Paracoccus aminovorans]MDQ7776725.1 hypothetical protein [Paracoccus aminovorans]